MFYQEHKPAPILDRYVKCYYSLEYMPAVASAKGGEAGSFVVDHAFATGCIEVMFTLEGDLWQTKTNGAFIETSQIGVWGQILKPLMFRVTGHCKVFGIRFFPAAAAFFLKEDISKLNDSVLDLTSVVGNQITGLHARLQDAIGTQQQIDLVDAHLLKKLEEQSRAVRKIDLVQQVMNELSHKDFFDNIENVAERYGITSRYLQKVFVQYTGLTPKLYAKINRFQNSLVMLGKENTSLTAVAYASGYFDQSHFIREFKTFTGLRPSAFQPTTSTAILASPNK